MGTAVAKSEAAAGVSPWGKLLPAMGLLSSPPAILLAVNLTVLCWAAQATAEDKIRWW